MSTKKLKLYLFAGRTVLNANKLKSIANKLPTNIDISRRLLLRQQQGLTEWEPFELRLTLEETKDFCKEINLKVDQNPEVMAYLTPEFLTKGTNYNLGIVKIILTQ